MQIGELFNSFNFEERNYYYHITESGIGDVVFDEGLLMERSEIWRSLIRITPDMLWDLNDFLTSERKNGLREADQMIIVACDSDKEDELITPYEEKSESWTGEDDPHYTIFTGNILGYVDLTDDTYPFTPNPNCFAYEISETVPYQNK